MTALKELGLEEMAVLDAIIVLRLSSENDIFEYDCKEVQKNLNRSDDSKDLIITLDIQRKIVMDLSRKRVLSTDRIIDNRFKKNFQLRIDPYCIGVPCPRSDFFWENKTHWAYEELQEGGRISIEDAYAKYGDKLFIKMTKEDIDAINYNYRASHTVETKLAKNKDLKPCFYVIIDGGKPICVSELRENKKPLKILVSAFRKKGTTVYRSDLIEEGILPAEDRDKSLRSDIFKDNKHILNADPFLLEIHSDRLMVKKSQKVTLNELNQLKTRLKIS